MPAANSIPASLRPAVARAIASDGDESPIVRTEPAKGGYTSLVLRVITRRGSYLLKWIDSDVPGMYSAEATGLGVLREAGVLRVPRVLAFADPVTVGASDRVALGAADLAGDWSADPARGATLPPPGAPSAGGEASGRVLAPGYLLEEWIGHRSTDAHLRRVGSALGGRIVDLHRWSKLDGKLVPGYGLHQPIHFGSRVIPAGWRGDWVEYLRELWLRPRIQRASELGLLETARRRALDYFTDHLEQWLGGVERQPSLLHGDLWRGNVLTDSKGEPALADPCAFFGDRELELAYAEIAGRMPPAFFDSYRAAWAPAPGYDDRRAVYHLVFVLGRPEELAVGGGNRIDSILCWLVGSAAH